MSQCEEGGWITGKKEKGRIVSLLCDWSDLVIGRNTEKYKGVKVWNNKFILKKSLILQL